MSFPIHTQYSDASIDLGFQGTALPSSSLSLDLCLRVLQRGIDFAFTHLAVVEWPSPLFCQCTRLSPSLRVKLG